MYRDKEKYRAHNRRKAAKFRKKYPEKRQALLRTWRARNVERCREQAILDGCRRDARKKENGGSPSRGIRRLLFEFQRGVCVYCESPLTPAAHLDHIMPLALGGSSDDENLQLLCPTCNVAKGMTHPVEFVKNFFGNNFTVAL